MVLFNHSTRELTAKIVYYGPGLCGKTTNLRVLHERLERGTAGRLLSLATAQDRTIYFDLLPVELGNIKGYTVRFQLCTVPGQVFYNETRKLVLRGVDGIVFVVDSQWSMLSHNLESFQNLRDNLREADTALESIPLVVQYNKRDLPGVLSIEALQESLNFQPYPYVEAVASAGRGVVETFRLISKLTFVDLLRRLQRGAEGLPPDPRKHDPLEETAVQPGRRRPSSGIGPPSSSGLSAARSPAPSSAVSASIPLAAEAPPPPPAVDPLPPKPRGPAPPTEAPFETPAWHFSRQDDVFDLGAPPHPPAEADPFAVPEPPPVEDLPPPSMTIPVLPVPEPVAADPEPVVVEPEPAAAAEATEPPVEPVPEMAPEPEPQEEAAATPVAGGEELRGVLEAIEELRGQLAGLPVRFAPAEAIEAVQSTLDGLMMETVKPADLQPLRDRLDELAPRAELGPLAERMSELGSQLTALDERLSRQAGQIEAFAAAVDGLRGTLAEQEGKSAARAELYGVRGAVEGALGELRRELEAQREELAVGRRANDGAASRAEVEELRADLETRTKTIGEVVEVFHGRLSEEMGTAREASATELRNLDNRQVEILAKLSELEAAVARATSGSEEAQRKAEERVSTAEERTRRLLESIRKALEEVVN